MGRWDRFYEARSITSEDLLADEIVKTLAEDLRVWPPPVLEWHDAKTKERFLPALEPGPEPVRGVYRAAFQLARWELEREYEAIDDFYRNDRAVQVTTDAREKLCLIFLHRWLTDSMLELLEVTPLKRPRLVDCLRRIETRVLGF